MLLDPYGGPHAQRVLKARSAYLTAQWFAEQGFAVVIADGRGTPGRGPEWERAVAGDLAGPVLEDQVDALREAAARFADLDTGRVAIRGWSFGGYLAALAVLRRPDVFHAAIAGAPVTDWRLYDTHYTERYLGLPGPGPRAVRAVLADHMMADTGAQGRRQASGPLMLIHGLADDNVVVAHTLRLSGALLAAGVPAHGAAAVRHHPHGLAGGGGGEPAPAPARLPPRRPRGLGRASSWIEIPVIAGVKIHNHDSVALARRRG